MEPSGQRTDVRIVALRRRASLWWTRTFGGQPQADVAFFRRWAPLLLTLLAGFLFFFQLDQPLLDPDEGRQAEIPREMVETGDWLVPTCRGKAYYEKPPLQYWLTATLYLLFGVAPATARLVPAAAACATVLITYSWGRRALGARAGFLAGLVLCLTPEFFILGRTVLLDSLLTLCVVAGWFAAQQAVLSGKKSWWVGSAVVCGLGILQKGPVILILVLAPVTLFSWLHEGGWRLGWRALTAFLVVAIGVAGPWYVSISLGHPDYVETFLWRSNVIRFVRPFDHLQPWWFYGPVLLGGAFPWSLLLPGVAWFLLRRNDTEENPRSAGLGMAALAFGWCFAFYSASGCKSPPYLMPALPVLAILIGALLDRLLFGTAQVHWMQRRLPLAVSLAMLLLAPIAYLILGRYMVGFEGVAITGLILNTALLLAWWFVARKAAAVHAWGFLALLTFLGMLLPVKSFVWAFAARRSPEAIARIARPLLDGGTRHVVLFDREWPSAHFYLESQELRRFDWETQESFRRHLQETLLIERQSSEVLVLVDAEKVERLVRTLPPEMETNIRRTSHPSQPALVVIRPAAAKYTALESR